MATKASVAQIRKIHVLARERGMDRELLHTYLYSLVKKESVAALSVREAIKVIDGLSGRGARSGDPLRDGMSPAQRRYILGLAVKAGMTDADGNLSEDRLNRFCRSQYSVLYYTALTRSEACRCIEALKSMAGRMGKGA